MSKTTFSGPIKSGPVQSTTGTNVQSNMADVGFTVVSQSAAVTQTATDPATTIIIPAFSRILSIQLFVTTAWNGAASTAGLGWDNGTVVEATALTTATSVAGGTVGMDTDNIEPGASAARTNNWLNTGTDKKRIRLLSSNNGAGVGTLVVNYVQAQSKVFTV
tara:strand:- start:8 stop:493 length:486 start_codon:yes stop_codon:yes gene_type:complete